LQLDYLEVTLQFTTVPRLSWSEKQISARQVSLQSHSQRFTTCSLLLKPSCSSSKFPQLSP